MAARKSTPIIVIGVAVFVIGAALAFVVLRGDKSARTRTATAVVARAPVPSPPTTTPPATSPTLQIPPGKDAVPVQTPQLQGLDGFAKTGDLVNVYATIRNQRINIPGLASPEVKLIASDVQVLDVLTNPPTAAPTGTAVYMLALDPVTAEQVIFFDTYESLYFTLVPKGSAPAQTPGRSYQNAV